MRHALVLLPLIIVAVPLLTALGDEPATEDPLAGWSHDFAIEQPDLVPSGRNPYWVLEPGFVMHLGDGETHLRITVKQDTVSIDGVECRVIEEYETEGDQVTEVSNNYFAISRRTNSVYYFGEDAGGAWLSGVGEARFGLMMPGLPLVGARFYQEVAPGVAMDRAEIAGVDETVTTPAGVFEHCLKVRETTPLEPDEDEFKCYAPGIGLIVDGSLRLMSYGPAG